MKQFLKYEDIMRKLFSSEEPKIELIDDKEEEINQSAELSHDIMKEESTEKMSVMEEIKGEIRATELEETQIKEKSIEVMQVTEQPKEETNVTQTPIETMQVAEEIQLTDNLVEATQVNEEIKEVKSSEESTKDKKPIQDNCGGFDLLKLFKLEEQEILPNFEENSDFNNKVLNIQKEEEEDSFSIGKNRAVVPIPIYPTNEYEVIKTPNITKESEVPDNHLLLKAVNHAKVRIMNAASNYAPISVTIGNKMIVSNLPFGKVSDYCRIIDGYRTIVVSNTETSTPLAHMVFPFIAGTKITLVITNTANGLTITQISDEICKNNLVNRSCFRVANFSFCDGPFDITLSNGCVVFTDVMAKEDTPWKQAISGDYDFFVMNSVYETNLNELAGMKEGNIKNISSYVLDFFVKINANMMYTAYIIGGYYNVVPLQVIVLEN